MCSSFFFFNDTATTEIYTLSLHDALPISLRRCRYGRTPWRASSSCPGPGPGCISRRPPRAVHERRDQAADDRSGHRYPSVAPVRIALARDRQEGMSDSRTQVTRRVDRVAGRPTQRQPDGPHEDADQEWAEPRVPAVYRVEILRRQDGQ